MKTKMMKAFLLASVSDFALSACVNTGGALAVKDTVCENRDRIIAAAQATIAASDRLCPSNLESETDAIDP